MIKRIIRNLSKKTANDLGENKATNKDDDPFSDLFDINVGENQANSDARNKSSRIVEKLSNPNPPKTKTNVVEEDIDAKIKKIREEDIPRSPFLKDTWEEKISELEEAKNKIQELKNYNHSNHKIPSNPKNFSANDDEQKAYLGRVELTPDVSTMRASLFHAEKMKDREQLPENMSIGEATSIANYSRQSFENDNLYLRSNGNIEGVYQKQQETPETFVEHLREKEHLEEDTVANVRMITSALNKLPDFNGTVYRGSRTGTRFSPEQLEKMYKVGKTIEEKGFTSTSYEKDSKFDGDVQYEIKSRTGKNIENFSNYPSEKEVLFRPGTQFKVTGFEKTKDGYKIKMEEV